MSVEQEAPPEGNIHEPYEKIETFQKSVRFYTLYFEKFARRFTETKYGRILSRVKHWRMIMAGILLFAAIAPLLAVGSTALVQYESLKNWGADGVAQLESIKTILGNVNGSSAGSSSGGGTVGKLQTIFSPATLNAVQKSCDTAQTDFSNIYSAISQKSGVIGLAGLTPYSTKITATGQLASIAITATQLCDKLVAVGRDFTTTFQTSPFATQGPPLLTDKSFADLQTGLSDTLAALQTIQTQLSFVNLDQLPVNAKQLASIKKYTQLIPTAISDIQKYNPYVPLAGWLLGVGTPRTYLIQTMDRTELRPGGGFTGDWGVLSMNGGRAGPISLIAVEYLDYNLHNPVMGQQVPAAYKSWWPFANWGLRDSNLSGDFATTSQLAIGTFQKESGQQITGGAIAFSPLMIEHLLNPAVLGPIYIPCYNVTITDTNLENELHYYQLGAGVNQQNACSSNITGTSLRKRFTATLANALEEKARTASVSKLILIMKSLRADLISKDLEIYIENPQVESLLSQNGLSAAMIRGSTQDSTYMVQANIGVEKGSLYAHVTVHETITLDNSGGAFHNYMITIDYQPTGPTYGLLTYRDYIRVYAPPQSYLTYGSGFDQEISPPLCYLATPGPGGKLPPPVKDPKTGQLIPYAPVNNPCQPTEAPTCQSGIFNPGQGSSSFPRLNGSDNTHIDDIGAPDNLTSDEQGRAMFGGMVVVPAFCTANIELDWYTPNAYKISGGKAQPYTFTIQRQSGAIVDYSVTIIPAGIEKAKQLYANNAPMLQDFTYVIK